MQNEREPPKGITSGLAASLARRRFYLHRAGEMYSIAVDEVLQLAVPEFRESLEAHPDRARASMNRRVLRQRYHFSSEMFSERMSSLTQNRRKNTPFFFHCSQSRTQVMGFFIRQQFFFSPNQCLGLRMTCLKLPN